MSDYYNISAEFCRQFPHGADATPKIETRAGGTLQVFADAIGDAREKLDTFVRVSRPDGRSGFDLSIDAARDLIDSLADAIDVAEEELLRFNKHQKANAKPHPRAEYDPHKVGLGGEKCWIWCDDAGQFWYSYPDTFGWGTSAARWTPGVNFNVGTTPASSDIGYPTPERTAMWARMAYAAGGAK